MFSSWDWWLLDSDRDKSFASLASSTNGTSADKCRRPRDGEPYLCRYSKGNCIFPVTLIFVSTARFLGKHSKGTKTRPADLNAQWRFDFG